MSRKLNVIAAAAAVAATMVVAPIETGSATAAGRPVVQQIDATRAASGAWKFRVKVAGRKAVRIGECRSEDSKRCVWDARARGSRTGTSFARIAGKTYRIAAPKMAGAYR